MIFGGVGNDTMYGDRSVGVCCMAATTTTGSAAVPATINIFAMPETICSQAAKAR